MLSLELFSDSFGDSDEGLDKTVGEEIVLDSIVSKSFNIPDDSDRTADEEVFLDAIISQSFDLPEDLSETVNAVMLSAEILSDSSDVYLMKLQLKLLVMSCSLMMYSQIHAMIYSSVSTYWQFLSWKT